MASAARYFPGEEPELARRLDDYLADLARSLGADAAAKETRCLILSGGYGRGEGGVFRDAAGRAALYNDLEFYLVLHGGGAHAAQEWTAREAEAGTKRLGIDVEFKLVTAAALQRAGPSMFYYDLASASRTVWGESGFVAALPERLREAALIPGEEAARLLFNRGSGLFYAQCALAAGDSRVSGGFVERNHAKARLALGDAVLAFNGRYHFSCVERARRIAEGVEVTPPDWERVRQWHAEGVAFKLYPRHEVLEAARLAATQIELVAVWLRTFLWLESRRLGVAFATPERYLEWGGRLFPGENRLRNLALHLRDRLRRGGALPGRFDYPRAALMRALVGLLAGGEGAAGAAARILGDPPELERAYRRWWDCYN